MNVTQLPVNLRARLLASVKELTELKTERDSWVKTALALKLTEVKKPGT
jgi:hypothetical protein